LERFPIFLVGCIFNSDGVVNFADFMAFFGLALALLWNIYMLRRGELGRRQTLQCHPAAKQLR
jgi:hypothetical protein